MILYVLLAACIILASLCAFGVEKATDYDYSFLGASCLCLGIIFVFGFIICCAMSLDYTDYLLNTEARLEAQVEKRAVYVTMLGEISNLIEQDVTASDTYMEIYKNTMNFNKQVRRYEKWGETWAEGLLCDPTYKGLEVIPLN